MKTANLLISAYVDLLKIEHSEARLMLQSSYCILRDQISKYTGKDAEEVQITCEQIALQEKLLAR